MTGRGRSAPRRPSALLVDLWNALLVPQGSRRSLEADRSRPWIEAVRRAGVGAGAASREVVRMRVRAMAIQATGRSVPITEQARLLARQIRRPIEVAPVIEGLRDHVRGLRVRVAEEAFRSLDRIRARSVPVGLVSNILYEPGDAVHALLERSGLARRLDVVYLSIEHRAAKPSPEPFRSVLRSLGVHASDALHVGDHTDDLLGARAAGVPVVRFTGFLDRYPREPPAVLRRIPRGVPAIRSWDRFPERLGRLFVRAERSWDRPAMTIGPRGRARSGQARA